VQFNAFMRSTTDFGRVLWTPRGSVWTAESPTHPFIGTVDLNGAKWTDVFPSAGKDGADGLIGMFGDPTAGNGLDLLSVRYVAVSAPEEKGDVFSMYQLQRGSVIAALDAVPQLHARTDLDLGDLRVYENDSARPHEYTTESPDSLSSPVPFTAVEERVIDISRRELTVRGIKGPFFLHFTDGFYPGWELTAPAETRLQQMLQAHHAPTPGVIHSRDVVHTNLFQIDPDKACAVLACTHEPDGTITMKTTLFFAPQAYFDIGSVIAFLTMLGVIGYLWASRRSHPHA
jgi:hypothetical protein